MKKQQSMGLVYKAFWTNTDENLSSETFLNSIIMEMYFQLTKLWFSTIYRVTNAINDAKLGTLYWLWLYKSITSGSVTQSITYAFW